MHNALRLGPIASLLLFTSALAAPQLDQSNDVLSGGGTAIGNLEIVGQVVKAGRSGVLTSVDFSLRRFSDTLGNVTLQLRGVSDGKPNATILGAKVFPVSAISLLPAGFTSFDIESLNLTLSAGDSFAIVFSIADHSGTPFPIGLTGDTYPDGNLYGLFGGNWGSFSQDAGFRTFVEDPLLQVGIDVKPGSDPNCFNINDHGVIPVAILGSSDLYVNDIDPLSLSFGGLAVRVRGKKGPLCGVEYVNDDPYHDLVCQFEDDAENWATGTEEATLTGTLYNGSGFTGTDAICIAP